MGSSFKTIVWFRRDLRIEDNPALAAAARDGCVLPVYIWCPKEEGQFYPGRVSRWWLKQSLAQLDQALRSLGSGLVLIKAETTLAALLRCIGAIGATRLVFNHLYGMLYSRWICIFFIWIIYFGYLYLDFWQEELSTIYYNLLIASLIRMKSIFKLALKNNLWLWPIVASVINFLD